MIKKFLRNPITMVALLAFSANCYADTAIFAMGCFWSGETFFRSVDNNSKIPGIEDIVVGYVGGTPKANAQVQSGYREAVQIEYNPVVISYDEILDLFWRGIDPFDSHGQFCDKGSVYTTAIYYTTPEQQKIAQASKANIEERFSKDVATSIIPADTFYPADPEQQDYKTKHPLKYFIYKFKCGREGKLQDIWGVTKNNNNTADY